ncbi:hypothetical protein SPRG_16724, partial [Saprolegnia parasitica CBS 223.65]
MTSVLDVCSFAGCSQPPRFGSTKCVTHRNKLQCTFEGCKNQVYARYLCIRHGGKKKCEYSGCDAPVHRGAFCVSHGGVVVKRYCTEPGCSRQAHARYKCVRHGGGRTCKENGCDVHARASGYCRRHTARPSTSGTPPVGKKVDLADHINAELLRVGAKVANLMTLAALKDSAPPFACEETALDASILDLLCDAPLFGED